MKKVFTLATLLAVSTSAVAGFQADSQQQSGGFQGTGSQQGAVKTVAQVEKAYEDTPVTLTGYITRQMDHDEFFFKDSTGEIKIEVEDYAWNGQNVTAKDKITIEGKVDKNDWGRADIDVYSIKKH